MREALDRLICARWPELLRRRQDAGSCMQFGFTHGDGWFALLDAVSETITKHAATTGTMMPEAEQVKEKFGGIRIYLHGQNEYARGAVWFADTMSYRLCEITGLPGLLHVTGACYQTLSLGQAGPKAKRLLDASSLLARAGMENAALFDQVRAARAEVLPSGNLDIAPGWLDIGKVLLQCLDGNTRWGEERDASRCVVASLREVDGKLAVSANNLTEWESGAVACATALTARTDCITGASGPVGDDGAGQDTSSMPT